MKRPSTILAKDSIYNIAIGSFDGIHLAHMQLINRLGDNGALFVIDKDHADLTPGVKRSEYSKHPCIYCHFSKIKDLSGLEFVNLLKKEFVNLKKIIIGYDFRFGKLRSCCADDLRVLYSGEVEIVEEFFHRDISVHSSYIRDLLYNNAIDKANSFLSREYSITGRVVKGQGIAKKNLYPTINIDVKEYLIPSDGVYATRTRINDKIYNSISFIGTRVSTDSSFSIETHVINKKIETVETVEIFFVHYIRENRKFSSLGNLKQQITIDINNAKSALSVCKVYNYG